MDIIGRSLTGIPQARWRQICQLQLLSPQPSVPWDTGLHTHITAGGQIMKGRALAFCRSSTIHPSILSQPLKQYIHKFSTSKGVYITNHLWDSLKYPEMLKCKWGVYQRFDCPVGGVYVYLMHPKLICAAFCVSDKLWCPHTTLLLGWHHQWLYTVPTAQ